MIDFMLQHPILTNRPIVVTSLGTRLRRPSQTMLQILLLPRQRAFAKVDERHV